MKKDSVKGASNKFGTFKGVFVPSTEAILGTVLFLILPALTIDFGLVPMLVVLVMAHSVTVATSFSLADCATNLNNIGSGGMYALSRRSLGKAFGGSIGVMLFLAQAASIGFYCIGFAAPLQPILAPLLNKIGFLADNEVLQSQIIAGSVFLIFFITVMIGADFTLKLQSIILVILFLSVLTIFISPFIGLQTDINPDPNIVDLKTVFESSFNKINLFGARSNWDGAKVTMIAVFFLTFTQFFPAVTGIDAGVGMSGDLKDPKKSLVRGTFASIALTFVVYIICTFIFSMMKVEAMNYTLDVDMNPLGIPSVSLLTEKLGLNNPFPGNIFGLMILLGILFATSSSALSCFMTAPRTAQSLARDKILPGFLSFLKRDFKIGGSEPRFATVLTFFIALAVIIINDINIAAIIVGICFLVVYGWVNVSAFFERISKNPTFRPTFKGHWAISLYGFLAAIITICIFDPLIGVSIIAAQLLLFWLILRFKSENRLEGVWWGVLFSFVTSSLKSLKKIVQGSKNWRPIVTAFSFDEENHSPDKTCYISDKIASYQGLVNMNVIELAKESSIKNKLNLDEFNIPVKYINTSDPTEAILSIVQASNPGSLESNSILLEYSTKINSIEIINQILRLEKNVFLIKNSQKLEKHEVIDIWWRGEKNGNLMVLLAYIINNSIEIKRRRSHKIRIIRKLGVEENSEIARAEMTTLLQKARLSGEVMIIPHNDEPFIETLHKISSEADLVMMGLPGNIKSDGLAGLFKLNEVFFNQEITRYDEMPTILFVKSAYHLNLIEE